MRGVIRGKTLRTTISNPASPCPADRVKRQFKAERPNQLWVSDFTYVSTWQGLVFVAFVIDVFARRIVGWRVSSSARTDFVLDTLEQALYERRPGEQDNTTRTGAFHPRSTGRRNTRFQCGMVCDGSAGSRAGAARRSEPLTPTGRHDAGTRRMCRHAGAFDV